MRILTAFVLAAVTTLAGCGSSVYWYNADKTLKQAKQDCRECYVGAQTEAAMPENSNARITTRVLRVSHSIGRPSLRDV